MFRIIILLTNVLVFSNSMLSQQLKDVEIHITYSETYFLSINDKKAKKVFHPTKGHWNHLNNVPNHITYLNSIGNSSNFELVSFRELPLNDEEVACFLTVKKLPKEYSFSLKSTELDGKDLIVLQGNSVRIDANGNYFKLTKVSGRLIGSNNTLNNKSSFANSSVLASGGDWYKVAIHEDGIYKLDYQTLLNNGVINGEISSESLNVFGNGGGMLSPINGAYRGDDLNMIRIHVEDGGDGVFSSGDYILFYGQGPHQKNFDGSKFIHNSHLYCDSSYYFVNLAGPHLPYRIGPATTTTNASTHTVSSFLDFKFIEQDDINLLKSGSQWYGDVFDVQTSFNYQFNFPNLINDSVSVKAKVIGKSAVSNTYFSVSSASESVNLQIPSTGSGYYAPVGKAIVGYLDFVANSSNSISIDVDYNKTSSPSSKGYLDYIEVNARRNLIINENDMVFSDPNSVGLGNVSEFQLQNTAQLQYIWEITDPLNPLSVAYSSIGNSASFKVQTDSLREFVSISGTGFPTPTIIGPIQSQNLHALANADMIIIAPKQFYSAAADLKVFHESEGLTVHLVSPSEIYNEFSSGMRDATAIKQFLRMFYSRGNGVQGMVPKYCLLFGDGTYDNRDRMGHGNNLIPVFESYESLSITTTYATDDYYAILSDGSSMLNTDLLNIAIGRLPVSTVEQANAMVQKIKNYTVQQSNDSDQATCSNGESASVLRDWRNLVTMISDDEDNNAYFTDIEIMAGKVKVTHPEINLYKIHSDAYGQESTAVGERIEGAFQAIKQQVDKGSLLVNYIGHGGESGWAHEQILTVPTINDWSNYQRLPVFMTATCEFSRFDDHDRTSAGEYVILNPDGGGICLFTTTRLVYATPNEWLNRYFYDTVFDKINDLPQRLGDIYKGTKNKFALNSADPNFRKFALLGDPALKFSYPEMNIIADSINGISISVFNDTIKALSRVKITGHIANSIGQKLTDFNGFVYSKIYDKISLLSTLGTNPGSSQASYEMWKNQVYKGKSTVINGDFSFEFIVPQDISFDYGAARFSFYAENGIIDANGFNESILIGGINEDAELDEQGPQIELFMNEENFVSGGITDAQPIFLAKIFDENGVNTVGNGIGHDIEAYLDGNTAESIILNDYYEAELNTYKRGEINYPLSDLEEGVHSITLKVWDVYNNSSKATIDFEVVNNENLALAHVLNYPNPFNNRTEFFFEHNQHCDYLDVQVQIFTISGKLVKTINKRIHSEGYRSEGILWDAKDDYGDNIAKGVYVYTLKVASENGEIAEKTEKLVILN